MYLHKYPFFQMNVVDFLIFSLFALGKVSHRLLFTPVARKPNTANHTEYWYFCAGQSWSIFIIHTFTVAQVR